MINIFARGALTGDHLGVIKIHQSNTLAQLEHAILKQSCGIEVASVRLLRGTQCLPRSKSLQEAGLDDGCTVDVYYRHSLVISGSADNTAKLWHATSGALMQELRGHTGEVLSVAFSPEADAVVTGSSDSLAKIWNTMNGECIVTLYGHSDAVTSVSFSPDGFSITTSSADRTMRRWCAESGDCCKIVTAKVGLVSAAWSPDSLCIVTAGANYANVWRTLDGSCLQTLLGHKGPVQSAAFSSGGNWIVTSSFDLSAKVWDSKTGECLHTLTGHLRTVTSAVFSPDGQRIATSSADGTAKVWNVNEEQCLLTLAGHDEKLQSVAFSIDGRTIVTSSDDRTVRVWDSGTGTSKLTVKGHRDPIKCAAFGST